MRIGERLGQAVKLLDIDLKGFAAQTAVPYRTLQDYIGMRREPRADILAKICTRSRVSAEWLLTGQGPMLRGDEDDVDDGAAPPHIDGPLGPSPEQRRIYSLLLLLQDIDPESRDAIITDAFTRAATAQQLADLRHAVAILTARVNRT